MTMDIDHDIVASPRRARKRWIATLVSGAMLLGVVGVALWLTVLRPDASAQEYRHPNPPVALPAAYYQTVEEQIAQGLGLSVAQARDEIRADPNEGLFGVATRHSKADQLYDIEINAHKTASAQLVASGAWTQAQADATIQYWQGRGAKALGSDMTDWYMNHWERDAP
jgi:hypothetical protein